MVNWDLNKKINDKDKIYPKYSEHKTHPIHLWHPSGKGESFIELTIEEANQFIYKLQAVINEALKGE